MTDRTATIIVVLLCILLVSTALWALARVPGAFAPPV